MESLKVKGLYFAGEVLRHRRQYGQLQPPDRLFDGPPGRVAEKIDVMKIVRPSHFFPICPGGFPNCVTGSHAPLFPRSRVHSPFVYDIVRSVFMRDDLLPGRRDL